MKNKLLLILIAMSTTLSCSQKSEEIKETLISHEKAALDRWYKGDPSGFYEIASEKITYIDPSLEKWIVGKENFIKHMEPIRGKVFSKQYELKNIGFVHDGDLAILSFNLISSGEEKTSRWNSTEVFQKQKDGGWKIINSHWSMTVPEVLEAVP